MVLLPAQLFFRFCIHECENATPYAVLPAVCLLLEWLLHNDERKAGSPRKCLFG